ncbi:MAG: serine hydrolase domain-containing protein [Spirochaetaceae bacterium]
MHPRTLRRTLWMTTAAVWLVIGASAGTPVSAFADHLHRRVPELMERYEIPGVSVAVVKDGELAWAGAYGYADVAEKRPMTTRSICRAESISKSVTAWGVMKAVEDGLIDPDAPVARYLETVAIPEGRFDTEEITVRRLLSNSAGLPLGTIGPAVEYPPGSRMPTKRAYLADELRIVQTPGEGFLYSNVGYNLLELVIENVTGGGFESYMREEVLEPLGMRNASYAWQEHMWELMPTGYEPDGTPVPPYVYPVDASGGLFADVEDIARFVVASTTGSSVTEKLHTPVVEVSGLFGFAADAYGLGHFVETLPDGRRAVWHGGQGHGWMTHFHAIPESRDGIVILTNSQRSWPFISSVLSDWAEWTGAGRVKFGLIARVGSVLRGVLVLIVIASLAQIYRLARESRDGRRRLAPLSRRTRWVRALEAVLGSGIIAGLLWALGQPYLFVSSIFPGTAGQAAWALLLGALAMLSSALLPRTGG